MYTYKYLYELSNDMKLRDAEVTYRYRNQKEQYRSILPVGINFSPFFFYFFISCVVIHYNMSLKPLIWWKNFFFEFFYPENWKKNYWKVTEMCLLFSNIQWDQMSTERSLIIAWNPDFTDIPWAFSGHSEIFQLTEMRIVILWYSCYNSTPPPFKYRKSLLTSQKKPYSFS